MTSDDELFAAFRGGDGRAFDELFARYRRPIWAFFRRRTVTPAEAEELAQDTFVAVVRGADHYEARAAFRGYLFGIAFNLLSKWRRDGRHDRDVDHGNDDQFGSRPIDPTDAMWVRAGLAALDADDREVVMLREYEGLSYDEIAALIQIPVNTVRSRLFRARAALRARLAGERTPAGERS